MAVITDVEWSAVGDVVLSWGESARWDDRRQRLYVADCAAQTLHWLEGGEPPLETMRLPSMPTGIVLAEDGRLVVCLDDGLHVVDVDAGTTELLSPYPDGLGARANDATADAAGNVVTGTLNLGVAPGSVWQYSVAGERWTRLVDGIANTNGPCVIDDGAALVVGDTPANSVYRFDYDAGAATAGGRTLVSDHGALGGSPDGSAADAEGAVWSCVLAANKLARLDGGGVDRVVDVPVGNPSDVAFGGPALDTVFVTAIALGAEGGTFPPGTLLRGSGLGVTGRPEYRVDLAVRRSA